MAFLPYSYLDDSLILLHRKRRISSLVILLLAGRIDFVTRLLLGLVNVFVA
jgi:hypothetical protein